MAGASARRQVFVAYARADHEIVERLIADLQARDIQCWIDRQDLKPGTPSWEQALRAAIRASDGVLLVASPSSNASRYVPDELRIAEMYQRTVYPVWVAGDRWMESIPLGWGGTQHIDARGARYETALGELVATLLDSTQEVSRPVEAAPPCERQIAPRNPYKGLRAFTTEDAQDFFGRERFVTRLLEAMSHAREEVPRFQAVIGPSGSGKSSLVLAGVLPRLQTGALPGSERWLYLAPMVPQTHPLEALSIVLGKALPNSSLTAIRTDLDASPRGLHMVARRLVRRSADRVVLVVDQLEELFTLTSDEEERRRFIDLVVTAVLEPGGPLLVLLTLRADFYDRPLSYPQLGELIDRHSTAVLPMELTDLRAAIEQPAALPDVGVRFEGDLVGDLLFEVRGQAGALPLLQFTLDQLFERREGRCLTLAAYREMGGVRGALAQHAEATYGGLPSAEHRSLARALFLRLIDPSTTEQDATRRRATLTELELSDPRQTAVMRETAEAFIAARLLTTTRAGGVTTLEVSHEALIREWSRLAGWLHEAREDIWLQQTISEDAARWQLRGQPLDHLYRGTMLDEAQAWAERNTPSAGEMAFLEAGAAERRRQAEAEKERQQRELESERRGRRVAVILASVSIVFALAALLAALVAQVARTDAQNERNVAISRALTLEALNHLKTQPDLALLLSVEATSAADTFEARSSLLSALEHSPSLAAFLHGHTEAVTSVAFSPDGKLLASGSDDDTIRLWDVAHRQPLGSPLTGHTSIVTSVAFSPDGKLLASGSYDTTVRLWDVARRRPVGSPLTGHTDAVLSVAFSPDGKLLASGSADGTIQLWDVARRRALGPLPRGHTGAVNSVAFSPDGKLLASGSNDGTIRLWDVAGRRARGSPLAGHTGIVTSVAFSPDGKLLASGNYDDTIRLWDVASEQPVGSPFTGHTSIVTGVAFSRDGKLLASGSYDDTIRLWDVARRRLFGSPLTGHTGVVNSVAFTKDGKLLASGSYDGTVRLWNVANQQPLGSLLTGHTGAVRSVAFSPDGKLLASGSYDDTIRLWDVASEQPLGSPLTARTGVVLSVAFSPDRKILASGGDGTIQLWDVARRRALGSPLTGHTGVVNSIAFSPDGKLLASGSDDGTIRLWNVASEQPLGSLLTGHADAVRSVAFSPDGKLLAAGSEDGTIQLWDVVSRQLRGPPLRGHTEAVNSVAFSPDGKLLASGSDDDTVRLWDVAGRRPVGSPLTGHASPVRSVAFSPDGKLLASGSDDKTIRLWDVASGQPLGLPVAGHTDSVRSVAFSPGGKLLASGSDDRTIRLWDVSVKSWERRACRIANRNLTPEEWRRYLGQGSHHQTCPGQPS